MKQIKTQDDRETYSFERNVDHVNFYGITSIKITAKNPKPNHISRVILANIISIVMINEELNTTLNSVKEAWKYPELFQNISKSERWLSGAAGTYLLFKGITGIFSHPIIGLTGAALGAGLLYRGITGYCPVTDLAEQRQAELVPDEVLITETFVADDLG